MGDQFRVVLEGDVAHRWQVKRYSKSTLEWLDFYVRAVDVLPDGRYQESFWFEAKDLGSGWIRFVQLDEMWRVTKKMAFKVKIQ